MKQIIYICIIVINLYSKESTYPYPVIFEENGLIINGLQLFKSEKNQHSLVVSFLNNNDKYLRVHNNIVDTDSCKIIHEGHIIKNTLDPFCKELIQYFFHTKIKEIESNNLKIIIYGESNEYRAIIFKDDTYLISFSSNIDLINFIIFLKSIKEQDKQKQKIDYYLDRVHFYLKSAKINHAFQCLVSAYIVNDKDVRLNNVYNKLYDLIIAKQQFAKRNLFFQTR